MAVIFARNKLVKSLPRLKWLLLSIVLIYGWTVPGQYVWLGGFSPTDMGLILGVDQVARILIVTSTLQVMLALMSRDEIFSAIFIFLTPFQVFNHMQTRFALRFALTLEKSEELLEAKLKFTDLLNLILRPSQCQESDYCFEYLPITVTQKIVLALQLVVMAVTVLMGVTGFWS